MTNHNTVAAFVAGLLFGAVSGFGQGLPLPAPPPPVSILPPVGLVLSETAQVNIANPAALVYNSAGRSVQCRGILTFYNASGSAIGTATSFTIVNAQILSVKLPYASTGATDPRAVVWAAVTFTGDGILTTGMYASPSTPACTLASSIETYDSITGITHAFASVPAQTDTTVVRGCTARAAQ